MKKPPDIVIDTSIFVNPDSRTIFGQSPEAALCNFLARLQEKKSINCYMPPSVYEELLKFFENKPSLKETILINKKPPASYQAPIPSLFLYEFIEEFRLRLNKGLRVAEKYARKDLKAFLLQTQTKTSSHPTREDEEIIKRLREEYRTALREDIIDSKEDVDLILLAKELDALLATSDNGLVKWAQKLGIHCIGAEELNKLLEG
ncbi:MAG: RNA ligase partner protein [Candidatus Omnitrophota bacterium]|nr:RNA ligase partner protein [Candidatus Omnitrophota bacterium]